MNNEKLAKDVQAVVGWVLLAAAITRIPALTGFAFFKGAEIPLPSQFLWMELLNGFLLSFAGVQLVRGRLSGCWLGYPAIAISTIFGAGPLGMYLTKIIYLGPLGGMVNTLLALIPMGALFWSHSLRLDATQFKVKRLAAATALTLTLAMGGWHGWHLSGYDWGHGTAANISEIPLVPEWGRELKTQGPVHYQYEHTPRLGFSTVVFAGEAKMADVEAFAVSHECKKMDMSKRASWPNIAKHWKLNDAIFPQDFAEDDLSFVGRLSKTERNAVIIYFRTADSRFIVQSTRARLKEKEAK